MLLTRTERRARGEYGGKARDLQCPETDVVLLRIAGHVRMTGLRGHLRRLAMGLLTVSGLARRGYFIPYRYADSAPAPGAADYSTLLPFFVDAEPRLRECLARMAMLEGDLGRIGDAPPPEPRWTQDWFPGLDAAALYAMIRTDRPRRVVEIGSGHSTRFIMRAIADGGFLCDVTAIDPAPRADIAALPVKLIRTTVQDAGREVFASLDPGDVLSIDSSHIAMPASDVDLLINGVLPMLPPGVLVHIHDIFLPDDYPSSWSWRGYNEQSVVAPLVHGGGYDVMWSSRFVRTRMSGDIAPAVAAIIEPLAGAFETSLWLRKR